MIVKEAKKLGLPSRLHVDEFVDGALWSETTFESEAWMRISGQDWHFEQVEVETEVDVEVEV